MNPGHFSMAKGCQRYRFQAASLPSKVFVSIKGLALVSTAEIPGQAVSHASWEGQTSWEGQRGTPPQCHVLPQEMYGLIKGLWTFSWIFIPVDGNQKSGRTHPWGWLKPAPSPGGRPWDFWLPWTVWRFRCECVSWWCFMHVNIWSFRNPPDPPWFCKQKRTHPIRMVIFSLCFYHP